MLVLLVLLSYLLGSVPSGLIIGKIFYGTDIRKYGSGNLGGTNTFRTLGKKAGFIVTIIDIIKGTIATLLPFLFGLDGEIHPLICGMTAVLGHIFPIFAGFRGGKAVATSAGVILAYDPLLFLILLICFFICLYITKYVSLSSILLAILALIYSFFSGDKPLFIVICFLATFIIYRHRSNIKRIIAKTEPKIKWM